MAILSPIAWHVALLPTEVRADQTQEQLQLEIQTLEVPSLIYEVCPLLPATDE